jgi:hypothetical protein
MQVRRIGGVRETVLQPADDLRVRPADEALIKLVAQLRR